MGIRRRRLRLEPFPHREAHGRLHFSFPSPLVSMVYDFSPRRIQENWKVLKIAMAEQQRAVEPRNRGGQFCSGSVLAFSGSIVEARPFLS